MQFKRLVSGVCAASIAVTQTAIVPISVSATEYNYKDVPGFTDQYKATLGCFSTTGTKNWDNDAWDGISPVDPSVGKATFNSSTHAVNENPTPDEAKNVGFYFSCDIDDGYYQTGDKFDFTVYDLTLTLNKNVSETVAASEESVSNGDLLSNSSPIKIGAYPKAVKDSRIIVTYAIADIAVGSDIELSPELDITNTDGESIAGGTVFDSTKTTFEATLDENTAKAVAESGFILAGNDINVTDVTISVPEHTVSDTKTETLSNCEKHEWTVERADGWFSGNLEFHPSEITFSDFKDFIDNGSVTAEWSKIECKSRRLYFDSVNAELWSGNEVYGNWDNNFTLPRFDKAEKNSRLTIEYEITPPTDAAKDLDSKIILQDCSASKWENLTDLCYNQSEDGGIILDPNETSVTVTLTEKAAKALNNGTMVVNGCYVTVKKVTSLEADPDLPASVALNAKNFPNETFREVIADRCDTNKDGELTPFELAKLEYLNFDEPNEDDENPDLTYSDEKYRKIDDFTGIEYLTSLTYLGIRGNNEVRTLDISACKKMDCLDAGNCAKLEEVSLPDSIKTVYIYCTPIKNIDISKCKSLEFFSAFGSKLTSLDVSKNTNLKNLSVGSNSLVALDLTGLDSLEEFSGEYQKRDIELINNTFNLADLSAYGLDPGKVTFAEDCGATRNGNVLTFPENVESVQYTYDTGIDDKPLTVTLNVAKRIVSDYTVSYMDGDKPMTVAADKWEDVLKVMNSKDTDYVVYLNNDVKVAKLTFPTAAKAKSIAVYSTSGKTITTDASSVTLPIDTTFGNISIESTAKTFAITASKNLDIDDFHSEKLKTLKGGSKSVLTFNEGADNSIKADISGFGTILVNDEAELLGTVKVTTLKLNDSANVVVNNNSVTFTNIEIAGEKEIMTSICYSTDNFKPVTVTGNITAANSASKLYIYKRNSETEQNEQFSAGQTVLTAKTASLANVSVYEDSMPEDNLNYTLARVGSDIKLLAEKIQVTTWYHPDFGEAAYAQWSDVLSTIATNAKAGHKDYSYTIILLDDYDINSAFKMPAANTYSDITFTSKNGEAAKTLSFTGNITLTGPTTFGNIKLDSRKKVNNELRSVEFTIAAGKNTLYLGDVDANIKSVTSSTIVTLQNVTVGTLTANVVVVRADETATLSAMGAAWDGKSAPKTNVNIKGNLTAKTGLVLENSLSVGGIINAGGIYGYGNAVLVANKQANGKNALVLGKSGFDNGSGKISFVLVDPETGLTAEITEDLILGTIAGPYADQLVPSNDNLTEEDSYYIIKSGKNLIAKPKATAGLVTVEVNGTKAYYKNLNEAIADINTSGSKEDNVVIYLTQDMFPKAAAKLPLPSAGKYDTLTYKRAGDSGQVKIDITGDLTLTGDLILDSSIVLNKVDKNGNVIALGVNVGKYSLTVNGYVSEKRVENVTLSQFANISGAGKLYIDDDDVEISGKVSGTTLVLEASLITLGANASFAGSIESDDAMLVYDKSIAKNVKFTNITGLLELVVKDGEKTAELAENTIVASVTGDYTKDAVIIDDSDLKVVRSGNNLKAVKEENVVPVEASVSDGITTERTYDSVASAVNDISRINDKTVSYRIIVSKDDTFALPKANTYKKLTFTVKSFDSDNYLKLTTTKDITLTGDLSINCLILNKVDRNGKVLPMSVNLGNYTFSTSMAYISYNGAESQFANINGKGNAEILGPMTVSGKINVGTFGINNTVKLGAKSAFTAVNTSGGFGGELSYPLSIAKNVVFTNIKTDNRSVSVNIDGVKAGDQIATLKGDFLAGSIVINKGENLVAVRSGNKLVAVDTSSINYISVREYNSNITRAYDSIASAVADITRLNDAKGYYIFDLNAGEYNIPKLTLPAKGKCDIIDISTGLGTVVTITVSSDIALTCDLRFGGDLTIQKAGQKALKFTSPKNKDGSPVYRVYVDSYASVINGTLNGEPISKTTP